MCDALCKAWADGFLSDRMTLPHALRRHPKVAVVGYRNLAIDLAFP